MLFVYYVVYLYIVRAKEQINKAIGVRRNLTSKFPTKVIPMHEITAVQKAANFFFLVFYEVTIVHTKSQTSTNDACHLLNEIDYIIC